MKAQTIGLTSTVARDVVATASAAPSIHNTQPWLFVVASDHIDLYADETRRLPRHDPDGRALAISCGAALLNLRLAASHHGYDVDIQLLPDEMTPAFLARITFLGHSKASAMAEELYEAIPQRHTNRRPYEDRPVPPSICEAMSEAARQEGAKFYTVTEAGERRRLVDLIHDADAGATFETVQEAKQWTGVDKSRLDGVPHASLGPIPRQADTPFRDLAPGREIPGRGFAVFEKDPTLAILATHGDDRGSWLGAGQALQRVLLVATVEGLVSTFANQPVEAPDLRWLVREPNQPIGFPQMLFRMGYAPPAPATPRRPVDDVIVANSAAAVGDR
jgi:nitroreductase